MSLLIFNGLPPEVVTIVDEAYFELLNGNNQSWESIDDNYVSAIELVREDKNVVVIRTFSKAYGLAGARKHSARLMGWPEHE